MRGHAVCPKCRKYIAVNDDGQFRVHGPRNNRCGTCPSCGGTRGWHIHANCPVLAKNIAAATALLEDVNRP